MKDSRKAIVTEEHLEEARRLKEIWDRTPHETQAVFGEKYGIGNQSSVGQFLRGAVPLSMKAAGGFAVGLGCEIRDFSPRLADAFSKILGSLETERQRLERRGALHVGDGLKSGNGYVPVIGRDSNGRLPEAVWNEDNTPNNVIDYVNAGQADPYAFATEVNGLSMLPRFKPMEFALVEPGIEPSIEDDVLVRLKSGKDLLRRLVSDLNQDPINLASYADASILSVNASDISWIFVASYPFPGRKFQKI